MSSKESELKALIESQRRERESYHIFPETISPKRPLLFPQLTNRQKAVMMLSFFMTRKEIAEVLRMSVVAVSFHRKEALKRFSPDQLQNFRKLHKTALFRNFEVPAIRSPQHSVKGGEIT